MYPIIKRTGDILLSVAALAVLIPFAVVLFPVMLFVDGRPLFFTQPRAGLNGNMFRVVKLRTIETDHNPLDPSAHTTRTGRFLRRYGIDELPQIINIIRGEMSFVGPRPILLPEAENYDEHQRRRLSVRPGITGWAQVNGRNALGWQERIERDLWYVDHAGVWLDLKILLATPAAVLRSDDVYGPGNLDPTAEDLHHLSHSENQS